MLSSVLDEEGAPLTLAIVLWPLGLARSPLASQTANKEGLSPLTFLKHQLCVSEGEGMMFCGLNSATAGALQVQSSFGNIGF